MNLENLRGEIDRLDEELLQLLNQRMEVVRKVGVLKHKSGGAIYRPEREKAIINKMNSLNNGLLTPSAIEALYLEIFAVSRNLELPEKVAFLGPEGSFTQQAAESRFGGMSDYISLNSITSVFKSVDTKKVKFGVVPIENSTSGMVSESLSAFENTDTSIVAEVILNIHLDFATKCNSVKDIKVIYSKDVAFGQCRNFLDEYGLDDVKLIPVESTVKAVKIALEEPNSAALCPHIAAKLYNLPILFENVEDRGDNKTRFLIISDFKNAQSNSDKTSILARLPDEPGSLVNFLKKFQDANINLTKIESHMIGATPLFFIDFDGHQDDDKIKNILNANKSYIKILGSYVKEIV